MARAFPILKAAVTGGTGKTDLTKEAEFHRVFTRAFTHWQFVDRELFKIFSYLVSARQPIVSGAVYTSIINFLSKLQAVDAAAKSLLPLRPELLAQWEDLFDRIRHASQKKRNKLAHFEMLYVPMEPTGDLGSGLITNS